MRLGVTEIKTLVSQLPTCILKRQPLTLISIHKAADRVVFNFDTFYIYIYTFDISLIFVYSFAQTAWNRLCLRGDGVKNCRCHTHTHSIAVSRVESVRHTHTRGTAVVASQSVESFNSGIPEKKEKKRETTPKMSEFFSISARLLLASARDT